MTAVSVLAAEGNRAIGRPGRVWFRSALLNLSVLTGAVLLCCLVMEGSLRIMFARSLDFSMEMWKYAVELKRPVADPSLSFVHAPGRSALLMGVQMDINSSGHRDREYVQPKPPGVFRIVMLGDSTTLGWGVPAEQTVAKILEEKLNRSGMSGNSRFEVINAGVGNYNTVQEVAHYLTVDRAFQPDLVILQYFINDAEPVPTEGQPALLGRSYLAAFAISRLDALMRFSGLRPNWKDHYAGLYRDDSPGLQAAKEALARLAAVMQQDGTKLLVTILPELHQINRDYPFVAQHEQIKKAVTASGVPVMDLIDGLRGHVSEESLWVTPDDDHPNGTANALVADQVLPWVLAHLYDQPLSPHPHRQ
jgi:lysophospholipase L1-like esterase